MKDLAFNCQKGQSQELIATAKQLRFNVFVTEQNIPASQEMDDQDFNCCHFVAYIHNRPVATARLSPQGKLTRMAVIKLYRRHHVGSFILKELATHAKTLGLEQVYCHAQTTSTDFYKKNGFQIIGKPFNEAGILHIKMQKNLALCFS